MRSATETDSKPVAQKGSTDSSNSGKGKPRTKNSDMGTSLRQIYQRTVDEKIPDDLLDLLGKLD